MRAVCVRGRQFNGRQPSGLNKNNLDCGISFLLWGGGGGGGGVFAGHYGMYTLLYFRSYIYLVASTIHIHYCRSNTMI